MANIRVDLNHTPLDGEAVTFKAPCDASEITGLVIYYDGESKAFTLTDANGNDIGMLDNIFAEGAIVKAILDTDGNKAFVQNPNTNTYLESKFDTKAPAGYGVGTKQDGEKAEFYRIATKKGWYRIATGSGYAGSAIVTLHHGWNQTGTSDIMLLVSPTSSIKCLKCDGASASNPSVISNARLVSTGNGCALDVYQRSASANQWIVNIINTGGVASGGSGKYTLQTPTFIAEDDTLPDGETLSKIVEWQNPHMTLGVEYRTTERFEGKPVYALLYSCGDCPATGFKDVRISTIQNVGKLVRASFRMSTGTLLPKLTGGGSDYKWNSHCNAVVSSGQLVISMDAGYSESLLTTGVTASLYYTKTTD